MGHEEEVDKALYIDINIAENRSARIVVNEADRADKVASDFAQLHGNKTANHQSSF